MPAENAEFPWMSYYGHYKFFEDKMRSHKKVDSIKNTGEGLYEIKLTDERVLKVFICDCYSFSLADYYETIEHLGKIQCVIINSTWCKYTDEAKLHCREDGVGLFRLSDFMVALNQNKFWLYLSKVEREHFESLGRI